MPKIAAGEVYFANGTWHARVTLRGRERVRLALPSCSTEAAALERASVLSSVAKRLRVTNIGTELARKTLDECAAAKTDRDLRRVQSVVERLAGGEVVLDGVAPAPTFKQIAERWTSGELARQYPDQIRAKRTADDDESRLRMYIYPVLGDLPIDRVTLDACEEVMRRLPETLATATRRNIGQLVTRMMSMAVYPLRLLDRSPVPAGFLPSAPKRKALASLYPSEDARLMACTAVPFQYRLLWGFLTREGMRLGEALALAWSDLDLERGAVRLDKNKTQDPRAWALQPGTAAALRAYRQRERRSASASERVFLDEHNHPFTESGALGLPTCCARISDCSGWTPSGRNCSRRTTSGARSESTTCAARSSP